MVKHDQNRTQRAVRVIFKKFPTAHKLHITGLFYKLDLDQIADRQTADSLEFKNLDPNSDLNDRMPF